MKMFLTRMGEGAKMVVSGDVTQVDLPAGVTSGLRDAWQRLRGLGRTSFISLGVRDIVRHELVQQIVNRYEANRSVSGSLNPLEESEPDSQK
jgi:phosphate starvation-inducible PhoH-like protein